MVPVENGAWKMDHREKRVHMQKTFKQVKYGRKSFQKYFPYTKNSFWHEKNLKRNTDTPSSTKFSNEKKLVSSFWYFFQKNNHMKYEKNVVFYFG